MSEEATDQVFCKDCGQNLEGLTKEIACPACGSKLRLYKKHVHVTSDVRACVAGKDFEPGRKRHPFQEFKAGDSLFRKTGIWNKLERLIDRRNNRYHERITDQDGNLIHECDEPLDEHWGHGSAKHKPK